MSARIALAFGLIAWALTGQARAQSTPTGSSLLSGTVTSSSGTPIAEATISLTRVGTSESTSPLTTTSDRQGGFTFTRLTAGRYRLSGSKPGYTNRQPVRSPADRFDTGLEVTVASGQRVSPIELTLHREASLSGRVAEPDGIPAPDVQVFAAVRRGNGHLLLTETRTVAEWDGRFRIAGLPPGQYLVVILPGASTDPNRMRLNAERRAPESSSAARPFFETMFYPGVTTIGAAETVTVFEGVPVDGIDTWLMPGERHSIAGRVLWPEGVNAENIFIEYANLTAQRSGLWTVPEPGDLFRITGVPRGTVVLLARADSSRGPLAGVVTTEVNVDEIEDLELRLDRPGVVEGRVVYETNVPSSTRASRIRLRQRLLPVSPLYPAPEAEIAADGRFRLEHALGRFSFELPGSPGALRVTRVLQHGRTIADAQVRVVSGEHVTGLEVMVGR
jgi:hypothetical protein